MQQQLLRFITCGSVDDGKSTLIGRLLYDTRSLYDDQVAELDSHRQRYGKSELELAQLTDGLRAEREQGITIDVAYRFFETDKRRFIVADTPGHVQYTRNMATGASTADLAIVLIDAAKGVVEQTKRHTFIVSLLGIRHIVLCINKMDALNYSAEVFESISQEFLKFAEDLGFTSITIIPISALKGDNVVQISEKMPWYFGPSLIQVLEEIDLQHEIKLSFGRFPVQLVLRSAEGRGYAGQIVEGKFVVGEQITIYPSAQRSKIKKIMLDDQSLTEASFPLSVIIYLEDEIDVGRGDMLVCELSNSLRVSNHIEANLVWLAESPLRMDSPYSLKHTTQSTRSVIKELRYSVELQSLKGVPATTLGLNEIGKVLLKTTAPLVYDDYQQSRYTGSFILIDEATHATVAAGMIGGSQILGVQGYAEELPMTEGL